MSWPDYAILGLILLSALVGLARGLIREVVSLGVWVAALLVAWTLHGTVAELLTPYLSQPALRLVVAFAGLVLGVLILGAILAAGLTVLVEKTGLTGLDRLLGLGFGGLRGAVIVAMAVYLGALTPMADADWWQGSSLISRFHGVAEWVLGLVPEQVREELIRL